MDQRISVITLGVADLHQSTRFYEGLGWRRAKDEESVAFFQLNGVVLSLFPREALAEDAGVSPEGSGFRGIALAYNCNSRDEVDSVLARAERSSGQVVKRAQETFWGGYAGYFVDPDGHLWEVAWNPYWRIDADGNVHMD